LFPGSFSISIQLLNVILPDSPAEGKAGCVTISVLGNHRETRCQSLYS